MTNPPREIEIVPPFPLGWTARALFSVCLLGVCYHHSTALWRAGWLPYRFAPLALNAYWTSLAFAVSAATILLLWRRRIGLTLAPFIIITDVAINCFARFYLGYFLTRDRTEAMLFQSLFLLAVVAAAFYGRHHTAHRDQHMNARWDGTDPSLDKR